MNAPLSPEGLRQIRARAGLDPEPPAPQQDLPSTIGWPSDERISLCVVGLSPRERRALERAVDGSLTRRPELVLLEVRRAHEADVVVVDGADPAALRWSEAQRWLADRAVVWIERPAGVVGHLTLPRPIVWPTLPIVLSHARRNAPQRARARALVARNVQPHAPAVMVLSEDPQRRERLRWMLEAAGRRATLARTAREGLAALHAATYEGVILAGTVPDLERLALCGRVRALERRLGRIPLLLLDDEPGGAWDRLRARIAGYDEVAAMPSSAAQLRELLEGCRTAARPVPTDAGADEGELHGAD